jgi:diketogulonate reductase-like aldo/keto reductase
MLDYMSEPSVVLIGLPIMAGICVICLQVVEESNTPRSDLFFTSKLKTNRGYDETLRDLRNSLKVAGLDYFDLYLMHSAIGGPEMRKNVWRACVDAQKEGLVKSIGVSSQSISSRESS